MDKTPVLLLDVCAFYSNVVMYISFVAKIGRRPTIAEHNDARRRSNGVTRSQAFIPPVVSSAVNNDVQLILLTPDT